MVRKRYYLYGQEVEPDNVEFVLDLPELVVEEWEDFSNVFEPVPDELSKIREELDKPLCL